MSRRILFLASSAPRFPGDATAPFILNMAQDLCALGWQVDVLAPHASGLKKEEVMGGVTIHRFQYLWPAAWQKLCYDGGAAVNLKRNRLLAFSVPFLVAAEFLHGLLLLLRLRPVIVHSHWVVPQGVIGQLLSLAGVRHVISVHGTDIYGLRGRLMSTVKAWSLRHCDHVVANSTATRAEVEALCRPKSLSVIPTGSTPCQFNVNHANGRAAHAECDTKIVLYVGRLIAAKGVQYLIEAMPGILKRQRSMLLVVGEGPERAALERLAQSLDVSHALKFVGAVPHADIYEYFSIADVFVGPSIEIPGESTEAQGNTFVEALFARVPVVASRVGGVADAIVHEHTGLLVDQREPGQISESVLRVFSDAQLANRLKNAGHEHATQHFSRFQSARKLDAVYRAILGDPDAL